MPRKVRTRQRVRIVKNPVYPVQNKKTGRMMGSSATKTIRRR